MDVVKRLFSQFVYATGARDSALGDRSLLKWFEVDVGSESGIAEEGSGDRE